MSSPEALLLRFSQLYASLDNTALSALPEIYHRDIRFIDPVGEHQGLSSLQDYFRQLLTNLDYCRFTLTTPQQDEQQAVVCWQMIYAHPRLLRGQELTLEGISQLRFADRRIIYQRDYYDLGAMLYEHLPLVGQVVRSIKRRLRS